MIFAADGYVNVINTKVVMTPTRTRETTKRTVMIRVVGGFDKDDSDCC